MKERILVVDESDPKFLEKVELLKEIVQNRADRTGESLETAMSNIFDNIKKINEKLDAGYVFDVVDDDGTIIGYRDKYGYHEHAK